MDSITTMFALAADLDARGQYDLADRIETMARMAAIYGDEVESLVPAAGGWAFDPNSPHFRGNPQTKLRYEPVMEHGRKVRDPESGRVRKQVRQPWQRSPYSKGQHGHDPEYVTPGERPFTMGDEVQRGLHPSEWETYESPSGSGNDPRGEYVSQQPIDEGQIWESVMADLKEEFGLSGKDDTEVFSRLINVFYAFLQSGGDEEGMTDWLAQREAALPIDYDPELLKQAKDEAAKWVSDKFYSTEQEMQGNASE